MVCPYIVDSLDRGFINMMHKKQGWSHFDLFTVHLWHAHTLQRGICTKRVNGPYYKLGLVLPKGVNVHAHLLLHRSSQESMEVLEFIYLLLWDIMGDVMEEQWVQEQLMMCLHTKDTLQWRRNQDGGGDFWHVYLISCLCMSVGLTQKQHIIFIHFWRIWKSGCFLFFEALVQLPEWFFYAYFFVSYLGVVRNNKWPHFFRFHTITAILLEIVLSINGTIFDKFLPKGVLWGKIGMHYWLFVSFAFFFTVLQCMRCALRGEYADVPFISDASYMQIPYWFKSLMTRSHSQAFMQRHQKCHRIIKRCM